MFSLWVFTCDNVKNKLFFLACVFVWYVHMCVHMFACVCIHMCVCSCAPRFWRLISNVFFNYSSLNFWKQRLSLGLWFPRLPGRISNLVLCACVSTSQAQELWVICLPYPNSMWIQEILSLSLTFIYWWLVLCHFDISQSHLRGGRNNWENALG